MLLLLLLLHSFIYLSVCPVFWFLNVSLDDGDNHSFCLITSLGKARHSWNHLCCSPSACPCGWLSGCHSHTMCCTPGDDWRGKGEEGRYVKSLNFIYCKYCCGFFFLVAFISSTISLSQHLFPLPLSLQPFIRKRINI